MDPAEKATRLAQTISEGMNCLGVFMCTAALAECRAEAPGLLRHWETECAPIFRQLDLSESNVDGPAFQSGVAKLSALVAAGVDIDSPGQLSGLRAAIREVFAAFGIRLPAVPPGEAAICELHGAACPALGESAPSQGP